MLITVLLLQIGNFTETEKLLVRKIENQNTEYMKTSLENLRSEMFKNALEFEYQSDLAAVLEEPEMYSSLSSRWRIGRAETPETDAAGGSSFPEPADRA